MNDLDGKTSRTVAVHLTPTPMAPSEARHFVGDVLGQHPNVESAKLIASELVTNAVRHGGRDAGDIVVSVQPLKSPGKVGVRLEVSQVDHPGFTYEKHSAGHNNATGRGLIIVDAVAADWGVESDGTVWAVVE